MSWEEMYTKSVLCPCGKGKILQTVYGDDWNRVETGPVTIECDECKMRYKIDQDCYGSGKPTHGVWTVYYLIPIDYPDYNGVKESAVFPTDYKSDKSFYMDLIENYSLESLIDAQKEYLLKKSSSKVEGVAASICRNHKRRFNTVKYQQVMEQINLAIHEYDSYTGTYEQRQEIRKIEQIQREKYRTEKAKHRIGLDL